MLTELVQTLISLLVDLYSGKLVNQFSAKCHSAFAVDTVVLVVFSGSWLANVPKLYELFDTIE